MKFSTTAYAGTAQDDGLKPRSRRVPRGLAPTTVLSAVTGDSRCTLPRLNRIADVGESCCRIYNSGGLHDSLLQQFFFRQATSKLSSSLITLGCTPDASRASKTVSKRLTTMSGTKEQGVPCIAFCSTLNMVVRCRWKRFNLRVQWCPLRNAGRRVQGLPALPSAQENWKGLIHPISRRLCG